MASQEPRCVAYSGSSSGRKTLHADEESHPNVATNFENATLSPAHFRKQQRLPASRDTVRVEVPEDILRRRENQLHQAYQTQNNMTKEISKLRDQLEQSRNELEQAVSDRDNFEMEAQKFKHLWKNIAGEIDTLKSTEQGFYQVTDQYLIELVIHLRHNVQSFAIQFFDHQYPDINLTIRGDYSKYMEKASKTPGLYLKKTDMRPKIIAAFLWRVLYGEVFDWFHWLGNPVSDHMWGMRRATWPSNGPNITTHSLRKFQIWKATTVDLLWANLTEQEVEKHQKKKSEEIVREIGKTLEQFEGPDKEGFQDALHDILDSAFNLDVELSRQVAHVEWGFSEHLSSFDSTTMEVEPEEKSPQNGQPTSMSLAPAVWKRGKSNGEGFDTESQLMKNLVTCL